MIEITAIANSKCKYIRSLSQKKTRMEHGEYTVEGIKSVSDALRSDRSVSAIYVSKSFYSNVKFNYPKGTALYVVSDGIFDRICDTKAPQGILAVIKIDSDNVFVPNPSKAYIYCDGISDPGNLGTIIRTADAAGMGGVLLSEGCADLYSPKTVRASMGSFFNVNIFTNQTAKMLAEYKKLGFELIGGALCGAIDYRDADFSKPVIIIVGNEANGISEEVLRMCTKVKIPILGKAESLNAAVASAILMYEAVRQRT